MRSFPLLFLAACISTGGKDSAVDSADTAAPLSVAFDVACDTSGFWAVTAEVQGGAAVSAWDTIVTEAHGTSPGEIPLYFSEAHGDNCVTGVIPTMGCAVTVQVRVQALLDGRVVAQACSLEQSVWADCAPTAAPSCPL